MEKMSQEKTIAITRSKDDSEEFIQLITKHNATPITLPTIELVSKGEKIVDDFLTSVKTENPDYSVFMSSKAVKLLIESSKKISKLGSKVILRVLELSKKKKNSSLIATFSNLIIFFTFSLVNSAGNARIDKLSAVH